MTRCTASISAIICARTHPAGCREPDPAVARGAVFIPALSCWRMCRRGITSQKMSSPSRHRERIGSELELFAEAVNWRTYWQRQTVPFLGRRVQRSVRASALSRAISAARRSSTGWRSNRIGPRPPIWRRKGRKASCRRARAASPQHRDVTALYIDVLEHIGDDQTEVARVGGI